MVSSEILSKTAELLLDSGYINQKQKDSFKTGFHLEPVTADGSLRNFFRLLSQKGPLCVGVYPHLENFETLNEAGSVIDIGCHLFGKGIPVPEILAFDRKSGLILFEDCGNVRLHDLLGGYTSSSSSGRELENVYKDVVTSLVQMQINGRDGFDTGWCCDSSYYDRNIMVKKESEYFLKAFYYGLMSGEKCYGIHDEFEDLANHAGLGIQPVFLHRDFQSRNIMIVSGRIRIIDFQGGRIGPPGYDLASLLIDPYSDLSESFQEVILHHYLDQLHTRIQFKTKDFMQQYYYLSLQRNLQIIGAFSFLYRQRGKIFFKDFLIPALQTLSKTLARNEFCNYSILSKIVNESLVRIEQVL